MISSKFVMKLVFILVLSMMLMPGILPGQNVVEVRNVEDHKPMAGTTVSAGESRVYVTNEKGEVKGLEEGLVVTVSFVGFQSSVLTVQKGRNTIFLAPSDQMLNTLTVVAYENDVRLGRLSGSYAVNSRLNIDRFNDESLVRSMNTLPGIRFEERSPGSYRISIRGNLLRAPFGVRNVKVYWNNIPYTDLTGSTPINLLDLNNIGRVEVIKGPAGSVYGAGIGGVMNIYGKRQGVKPLEADISYTNGSFGLHKVAANLLTATKNSTMAVRYASQRADGYRDHTKMDREVLQLQTNFYNSDRRTLRAQVLYSDLFYELPGGLTKEQYDENPRMARPGAAAQNSSIDHQNFLAGLVQEYGWNEKIENTTALFYTNGQKENPFINNYELEKLKSFGGRTVFNIKTHLANMPTTIATGAEANLGVLQANNHGNVGGYADTLRYEDELKSRRFFAFLQADTDLSAQWTISAGASLNTLSYHINRIRDVALDTSYQIQRVFNPQFIPRLGVVGQLADGFAVHGSVSTGFSPPTTDEVRTSDGSINDKLEAERGINYELGMRGNTLNQKLFFDITTFWMQQKQTIVSKTTQNGSVVFENAGSTAQWGLEAFLGYTFVDDKRRNVSLLKLQTSYTRHHFTFQNYVKRAGGENVDYTGNMLTGTAPHISVTTFDMALRSGFNFNFTYNYTDEIPLNDANTVYADSYQLLTMKAGWLLDFKQKHRIEVFLGIDNLLNEKYSLGNDLNAFGQRYFNASPERNYFGGMRILINKNLKNERVSN
jgi:iron complex outermembrane receptor protein